MTKEANRNKNRDHVLWEEFVFKNNIKKKISSDANAKINKLKYNESSLRNDTVYPPDPGMRSSTVLENSKTKNLFKQSSPKINIDIGVMQIELSHIPVIGNIV